MRESYSFNVPKEECGIPLSTAQDHAVDATKQRIKLFADDLRRFIRGEKGKHKWQLVDKAGNPTDMKAAIAALDAKPKQRLTNKSTPNKAHNTSTVTPLARQVQSQSDKAALIERLYGGAGSLEKKFWPDA